MPITMPISASSRLRTRPQLSLSKYFQTKLKLRWYCTMGRSLLAKTPRPALSARRRGGNGEGRALPLKNWEAGFLLRRFLAEELKERGGGDLRLIAMPCDVEAGIYPFQPVRIRPA